MQIYAEDWAPTREPPASFELDGTAAAAPAEGGTWLPVAGFAGGLTAPVAFVDGTRRAELSVFQVEAGTGLARPGLAGAWAVGASLCRPGVPGEFGGLRRGRVCIWTAGLAGDLGPSAGYVWPARALSTVEADAPLMALQNLMRDAEADLAQELAAAGWLVVLDGPLNRLRGLDHLVAGYAKTHHRQLFPDQLHRRVPELEVGWRTQLWAVGDDRYTCYARVGRPTAIGSPWSGVVRLEFPSFAGLAAVQQMAGHLTGLLPRYAGRHHTDPRAPQNLQPVRALELQLARLLGPSRLATQAARAAVAHLQAA